MLPCNLLIKNYISLLESMFVIEICPIMKLLISLEIYI